MVMDVLPGDLSNVTLTDSIHTLPQDSSNFVICLETAARRAGHQSRSPSFLGHPLGCSSWLFHVAGL